MRGKKTNMIIDSDDEDMSEMSEESHLIENTVKEE